jgi:hypothetical protein
MAICPSCEGVIGRDCFNPEECMWITRQQASSAEAAQQNEEELRHILQQLKAEIAAIGDAIEGNYGDIDFVREQATKLRQLSAV